MINSVGLGRRHANSRSKIEPLESHSSSDDDNDPGMQQQRSRRASDSKMTRSSRRLRGCRGNNCNNHLTTKQTFFVLMLGILLGYILLPALLLVGNDGVVPSNLWLADNVDLQYIDPGRQEGKTTLRGGESAGTSSGGGPRGPYDTYAGGGLHPIDEPSTKRTLEQLSNKAILEGMTSAEKRLVEDRDVLSGQSLPTSVTPWIMKTPKLPDHHRMKILVTGGAGFVGSHLVDKLMMEGHEVIVMDNFFTGQKKNVAHWLHHPNFSLLVHDVTEPITLEVDQIYHLACPASPPHYQYNPVKTIKTSTMGTLNMLGLAKRTRARMLLTSTSEIYGDPQVHPQPESYWGNVNTIGPRACYDEGKRVAETMMYAYQKQNDVEVRVARIFNTFGPRMHPNDGRVVSNFIIQALQNKDMTIYGTGDQTRSFQYVSDLVDGLHKLMNSKYNLPVNLGNPAEFKVREFATYIKDMTKSSAHISFMPKSQDDPTQRKPDISTAKREIEWEPVVSVETGLKKTIDYFQQVLGEAGEIIPTGPGAAKPEA